MKKTVRINLGGSVFNVDDDAYLKLQNYLNAIDRQFGRHADRQEIMSDIEMRISELFSSTLNKSQQAITMLEVNEVIKIMGHPKEYADAGEVEDEFERPRKSAYKRMFRDSENRILGGVCSGMGSFFNVDPLIIRIMFGASVLLYGTGTLVYIILWAIIPLAKTTADKLSMKGDPITISNIESSVRDEFNTVKRKMNL